MSKALFQAALGLPQSALASLGDQADPQIKALIQVSLGHYSHAVDTLEESKELDTYGRYLYSKALFLNGEYERALIETQKLKEASAFEGLSESETQELKQVVEVLSRKVQMEVTNQARVGTINDAAYLTS
jgi:tetratricopeptide (TPR) repeat protein